MPIYRYCIETALSPQDVAERLRRQVKPWCGWIEPLPVSKNDPASLCTFRGKVGATSFWIYRNLWHGLFMRQYFWKPGDPIFPPLRNFSGPVPIIWGTILATATGSKVQLLLFMHPLVALFVLFWLAICGAFAVTALTEVPFGWVAFAPTGMFVFVLCLYAGGFWIEIRRANHLIVAALAAGEADFNSGAELPTSKLS